MSGSDITHSTFLLERDLPAPPALVYQAFADPDLKRRWFAEGEQHEVDEFSTSLHPGATERLRYRFREGTSFAGMTITNSDTVLDLVPEQRIISASRMSFGDACISIALTTIELQPTTGGTRLTLTFQGAFLPGADGPHIREMGWQQQLNQLLAVVQDPGANAA